jgi:hypothetical protein
MVGIGVVAGSGPLRSGWSHRAGTSPAVLAELNAGFQSSSGTATTAAPSSSGGSPAPPFSQSVQGTYQTSAPDQNGQVSVVLTLTPSGAATSPLVVKLNGTSVNGGVSMSSSQVTWGSQTGKVTTLQGSTIGATVGGSSGSVDLTMQLHLDQANGTVTGTVSGTSVGSGQ